MWCTTVLSGVTIIVPVASTGPQNVYSYSIIKCSTSSWSSCNGNDITCPTGCNTRRQSIAEPIPVAPVVACVYSLAVLIHSVGLEDAVPAVLSGSTVFSMAAVYTAEDGEINMLL